MGVLDLLNGTSFYIEILSFLFQFKVNELTENIHFWMVF